MLAEPQDEDEADQLAQQRVELFRRQDESAAWQTVGQGTVMWMPEGDRQRLMVVEDGEPTRPLGMIVVPSTLAPPPDAEPSHTPSPIQRLQPNDMRVAPSWQARRSISTSGRTRA